MESNINNSISVDIPNYSGPLEVLLDLLARLGAIRDFFTAGESQNMHFINLFLAKKSYSVELENQLSNIFPHLQARLYFIISNFYFLFHYKINISFYNQHLYLCIRA